MSATDPMSPERRQFSTRLPHWGWCLLAVIVFSGGGAWISLWWPYHREEQVVRMIVDRGGRVEMKRVCPQWLVELFGEEREEMLDVFDRVKNVDFDGSLVTDADLVQVRGLTHLEVLDLNRTNVSDAGIVHLGGLTNLKWLRLYRTPVTDAGLAHMRGLTNLERLNLYGTQVTNVGLVHLTGLKKLEALDLNHTHVNEDGVESLQKALPNCRIWR
jgi:hypothetical protein